MKVLSWALSDVGRKRDHNEDSFLIDPDVGLFAVADGMGGHLGGEHASRMAVEILRDELVRNEDRPAAAERILRDEPQDARFHLLRVAFPNPQAEASRARTMPLEDVPDPDPLGATPAAATVLRSAARVAGRAIYDEAQDNPRYSGMGTTLTAAVIDQDSLFVAHVGDSRCFVYRDGAVLQATQDHSWIAEQVRAGNMSDAEAKESKLRHIITRSVGFEREVNVDLVFVQLQPGDCVVLCSDGLSNYVDQDELARVLATTYYQRVPEFLVALANDRGGDDNITVIAVCVANDAS